MKPEEQITNGYVEMIEERIAWGFNAYILTFMFNQIAGSPSHIGWVMHDEIERIYGKILTRTWKHPQRKTIIDMPFWIGSPDWPVWKGEFFHMRDVVPNDGRHVHMIVCQPSKCHMRETLDDHIDHNQIFYSGSNKLLWHLHIEPIVETPWKVTRYALKSLTRDRASADDLILLPRTHGEMLRKEDREPRVVELGRSIITPTFEQDRAAAEVARRKEGGR